jgi:succinate dehydrogenase (ubiquinone) flavoprotein subunit
MVARAGIPIEDPEFV